ncbi:hypothetical protein LuPra_01818 [Luteitalea pratensis]|uniref:Uncharacterized protein n=1 Tax=Luteitalea pratensis TaxID=1855912 RepID=A0A143PLE7_LUTPR|nr:hypothetical protein [Luteitalea pratensis]AMY08614.1 hypothetical protein LuPra_01818 [Luteitalea pratensis]
MTAIPTAGATLPSVETIDRIRAIDRAPLRNLHITQAYHALASAFAARTGGGTNWCVFATWASRQAGQTIRGEDLLETLRGRLRLPARWLHPIHSLWRVLLARGLYDADTRLGRVVRAIQGPLDPFEHASDAVARGNRKVFEEIGREFARFLAAGIGTTADSGGALEAFIGGLRDGDPPDGQRLLRRAFNRYAVAMREDAPAVRAQALYLANLEIGWHEQTRLQPEILEALDAPMFELRESGLRILEALSPGASRWPAVARTPLAWLLGSAAWPLARAARALVREVITSALMTLRLPGDRVAWLGHNLELPGAPSLSGPAGDELLAVLHRFGCNQPCALDCGAADWSGLAARLHYIAHLFRALHDDASLFDAPFTDVQLEAMSAGRLPDGTL